MTKITRDSELRNLHCTITEFTKTDFELLDNKKRTIGSITQIDRVDSTPSLNGCGYRVEADFPATFYSVTVSAARNGEHYGAGQKWTYCKTIDEAREVARVKTEASRKSYSRKFKV